MIEVNDDNFAELIADADHYVKDLRFADKIINFDEGVDHLEQLLAVIDFLMGE